MTFMERLSVLLALYTKEDLAEKTGVSHRTVDGWIQGRGPSLPTAKLVKQMYEKEEKKLEEGRVPND